MRLSGAGASAYLRDAMAKKPNVPCAGCGKLLWGGPTSLPAGERVCRECRRATHCPSKSTQSCGRCRQTLPTGTFATSSLGRPGAWCRQCHAGYTHERNQRLGVEKRAPLRCHDCGTPTQRGATAQGRFCEACSVARRRARDSRKVSKRRTALRFTDITAEFERNLRKSANLCPLCGIRMTAEPGKSNSKQLDHIIPIVLGGTHTMGNVRIICRTCNLTRPKDGSDLEGHQATLWAQD